MIVLHPFVLNCHLKLTTYLFTAWIDELEAAEDSTLQLFRMRGPLQLHALSECFECFSLKWQRPFIEVKDNEEC